MKKLKEYMGSRMITFGTMAKNCDKSFQLLRRMAEHKDGLYDQELFVLAEQTAKNLSDKDRLVFQITKFEANLSIGKICDMNNLPRTIAKHQDCASLIRPLFEAYKAEKEANSRFFQPMGNAITGWKI